MPKVPFEICDFWNFGPPFGRRFVLSGERCFYPLGPSRLLLHPVSFSSRNRRDGRPTFTTSFPKPTERTGPGFLTRGRWSLCSDTERTGKRTKHGVCADSVVCFWLQRTQGGEEPQSTTPGSDCIFITLPIWISSRTSGRGEMWKLVIWLFWTVFWPRHCVSLSREKRKMNVAYSWTGGVLLLW